MQKKNILPLYLNGDIMKYTQVLVAYDISNDKKRRKVYEGLKDIGLHPIQKSVFWGNIHLKDKENILGLYSKYCDSKCDKVIMLNAPLSDNIDYCFGYREEEFAQPRMFEVL